MKSENTLQSFAAKFINQTSCHLFLTGKAGTGKTTFLRNITKHTHKNTIVAAPTGVAAINAGGVTLHSLFQLPFGTFIPENIPFSESISIQLNTPGSLIKEFQMNKAKRNMLRELELLIIDEVSMLRADLLDAIDAVLRFVRRKNVPFGGIQILFIGDLLQLPPVVKNDEKEYLSPYYSSIHFFNALALQKQNLVYIEFEKIYRQTDEEFIAVLNKLRDNVVSESDIALLNKYYKPGFVPKDEDGYIHLTTHNHLADEINKNALKNLAGKSFYFNAEVSGDFKDHMFPIENQLELKENAQVMFIKNDYSGEQRYFNGKIGRISYLSKDDIEVSFNDGSPSAYVEKYLWENKKYSLNKETNQIEEKVNGKFLHYPIKLAWAITVHKSQGLTFEKAIIDVSKAFAPGQIYVALSRLVSLNGLVLTAPVHKRAFKTDQGLSDFAKNKAEPDQLNSSLEKEMQQYLVDSTLNAFEFSNLFKSLAYHLDSYNKDEKKSKKQQFRGWALMLYKDFKELKNTGDDFIVQLKKMTRELNTKTILVLQERTKAAITYFDPLLNSFSQKITEHLDEVKKLKGTKKYQNELTDLDRLFLSRLQQIYKCDVLIKALLENRDVSKETINEQPVFASRKSKKPGLQAGRKKPAKAVKRKEKKPDTKEITLELYKQGKTIAEIAKERSLTFLTIEGHLAHFVAEGILNARQFVAEEKIDEIIYTSQKLDTKLLKPIKEELGDEFSYSEIRFAVASINEN